MVIWNLSNMTFYWFSSNTMYNLNTTYYDQVYDIIMDLDKSDEEYYG